MARDVIDRLDLQGSERVLDAGCGTGRVTALLADRAGSVIAVDGSEAMVEQTRARGIEAFTSDLVELEIDEPVDAILSTATFHWIEDHEALFARLFAALKPGGRLAAQCGGAGNIANVQAAIDTVDEPAFRGWAGPWNYATPEETRARLERVGFTGVWTWLQPWPVEPADPHEYFTTVILGSHLERLPADEHAPFVDAVLKHMGEPVVANYVRLNILARR
jgi:trans-aconitate 2-methyltransferase